ncbi:uncharacterized protein [Physcomitrium patens]|uniref:Transmembrane protein n=1 Tax=Physcomitrium patens TaxID=3218 RepID=A0A2K1KLQ6_PHYPA|nr:hypothetical protein PHYPA_005594 [Physcomitrium patens]
MASRMISKMHQDFDSVLWTKFASMAVVFLAFGAMLYQDHAHPRPPRRVAVIPQQKPVSRVREGSATSHRRPNRSAAPIPLTFRQMYSLLAALSALSLLVSLLYYLESGNSGPQRNHRHLSSRRFT